MAILKSVVDVNNGNTGWDKSHVMDALETVFANLGFHGGVAASGVPQIMTSPTGAYGFGESWRTTGGPQVYSSNRIHYYTATATGTSAYRLLRSVQSDGYQYWYSSNNGTYPNQIRMTKHGFSQGQQVHFAKGGTNANYGVEGLTLDTVYYVILVTEDRFKLAANATDAANGTEVVMSDGGYGGTGYSAKSNYTYPISEIDDAAFDNRTINIPMGDELRITLNTSGSGNMYLCRDTDDYDATKYITDGWSKSLTSTFQSSTYVDAPTGTGSDTGQIIWDTSGFAQSHTNPTDMELFAPSELGLEGRKYIYANDTNSGMKGVINVTPMAHTDTVASTGDFPFWDYTVPASGGRSALKLRVYRYINSSTSYVGYISNVQILTKGTGWQDDDVFTIPGDQIGGASPANDITFGVQTEETSTNARDGIPSVRITSLGAGSTFFQKANSGQWAVLKNVNDASKTYGTTFYSFGIDTYTNNRLLFNSGSGYKWLNKIGVRTSTGSTNAGEFVGMAGLDYQSSYDYPITSSDGSSWSFPYITYCTSSTPTAYPLEIRVYRAQNPQDTNFAIIQFCQTINTVVQSYGAFTVYHGATFGSNVWDYDYVFNGSMMTYSTGTRSIKLQHTTCAPHYNYYSSDQGTNTEPVNQYSIAREAFYGYLRDPETPQTYTTSEYLCNIETEGGVSTDMYLYYRNSAYDQYLGNSVDSAANYYKPFKGLPINERMVPCPYYLPDDFVMLQVSTTPGLTAFRTGDTVTVGGTETYEIIKASYQTQQNGLDGIDNNSTIGMLFMARIS